MDVSYGEGGQTELGPYLERRTIVRAAIALLLWPLMVFPAAGRLRWWPGWTYVAVTYLFSIGGRVIAARRNPDLLRERAQSLDAEDAKRWDKILMPVVGLLGPLLVLLASGMEQRRQRQSVPPVARLVAFTLLVGGYALATWAFVSNRFFSGTVRIQRDRGHVVVKSGPYRWLRHPGYAGGLVSGLATPLFLDAPRALRLSIVTSGAVLLRTWLEDITLQRELPGYDTYCNEVHYRLIPNVW